MTWTHETEPLTKRLRDNPVDDPDTPIPHEMMTRMVRERLEAATEIEQMEAEIKGLRRDLDSQMALNAGQLAEVERLREALDFYACVDHYSGGCEPEIVPRDKGQRARAALEGADK